MLIFDEDCIIEKLALLLLLAPMHTTANVFDVDVFLDFIKDIRRCLGLCVR